MTQASRKTSIILLMLLAGCLPTLWYAWVGSGQPAPRLPGFTSGAANLASQPARQDMSLFEQVSAVVGGYVLKPLHMLLSAGIIWSLLRRKAPDLGALRWGIFFFLLGEVFCAVNYLVFNHQAPYTEFLHSYGMVIGFGFTGYALMEGLDARLLHFSAPRQKCALVGLCQQCVKAQSVPCGVRRLILVLLPALLILSALPLAARLQPILYQTNILGAEYRYAWTAEEQYFEARYVPLVALLLFAAALAAMFMDRSQPVPDTVRWLAAAGMGALGFGLLRFTLKTLFAGNLVWADYWEELTELMFVVGVGSVLWLFRHSLFKPA